MRNLRPGDPAALKSGHFTRMDRKVKLLNAINGHGGIRTEIVPVDNIYK
jgi:hypothetical protein